MHLIHVGVLFVSLAVLCVLAWVGILHPRYDDTVTQRLGMCLVAFFAFFAALALLWGRVPTASIACTLLGCAVYAGGVFLKHRRRIKAEKLSGVGL